MSRISEALKRAGGDALTMESPGVDVTMEGPGFSPARPDEPPLTMERPGFSPAGQADAAELEIRGRENPAPAGFDAPDAPLNGRTVATPASSSVLLETAAADADRKLVANPAMQPIAVEQYRRLAAILHHAQEGRGMRRVLVASALAEEGKTLTAINLALTLSESYGRRVLLIDADMRRPGVSHVFGLPAAGGLSDVLSRSEPAKLALVQLSDRLSVLPAGHPTRDPMAALASSRLAEILDEAAQTFDWVIVDSPPVGVMSDAKLLSDMVDGVLLVIAAGRTPYAALQRATEAIGRERLLGVVLNRVEERVAAPGQYYYYRHYGDTPRAPGKPGLFARLTGRGQ